MPFSPDPDNARKRKLQKSLQILWKYIPYTYAKFTTLKMNHLGPKIDRYIYATVTKTFFS